MYVLFDGPTGLRIMTVSDDGYVAFHGDEEQSRARAKELQPTMMALIERAERAERFIDGLKDDCSYL